MYGRLVKETTYKEMVDFYEKDYKVFFENEEWNVNELIKNLVNKFKLSTGVNSSSSLESLKFTKFDTGLWFLSVAIWLRKNKTQKGRDKIVELCGDLPRIELFARQAVEGWDNWGNEVENNEIIL